MASNPCLPAEGLGTPIILQGVEPSKADSVGSSGCTGGFQANREAGLTGPALQTLTILEQADCYPNSQLAQSYRAGDRNLMETMN